MKLLLPLLAAGGLGITGTVASAAPPEANPEAPEPKVTEVVPDKLASVNGVAITTADVERTLRLRYGPQLDQMSAEQRATAIAQATPQMTEELIARALLLGAAADVEVSDQELEALVDDLRGRLPQEMKFGDYLAAIGREEAELRAELVEETKINKHLNARLEALGAPSDERVAAFYEENKAQFVTPESVQASHILLKTDPAAGDEGKAQKLAEIKELRAALVAAGGAGFAEAAKKHSDCPSGERGGDLGSFGRGQMVPEFEKAAFGQEPDEIGQVVETPFGFHLIQVTAKTEAGQRPLAEVRDSIASELDAEQKQAAVERYLEELEAGGTVERGADKGGADAPDASG